MMHDSLYHGRRPTNKMINSRLRQRNAGTDHKAWQMQVNLTPSTSITSQSLTPSIQPFPFHMVTDVPLPHPFLSHSMLPSHQPSKFTSTILNCSISYFRPHRSFCHIAKRCLSILSTCPNQQHETRTTRRHVVIHSVCLRYLYFSSVLCLSLQP